MKVLITGGYGFIGSHVAERFNKEGHDIYIIDNLSTGSVDNVAFKHKNYILDIEDRKCSSVFHSNKFDVVIHLAAQNNISTSVDDPLTDTKSNILGLINMLSLSAKYKVKKFIFASSAVVYGNNSDFPISEITKTSPSSPYALNKLFGESYCKSWSASHGLNTVVLRMSNVFGPRQKVKNDGGVVSIFIDHILNKHNLVVFGNGEQTRDFIYVEDVADAIYRSAISDVSGTFNVSSSQKTSINTLINELKQISKITNISYMNSRNNDILHSCLDNTRIKKALDWVPIYSLTEGLKKTFDWYDGNISILDPKITNKAASTKSKFGSIMLPYIENLIAFSIVVTLTFLVSKGYETHAEYYFLLYIVFMGTVFGLRQSVIATLFSIMALSYREFQSGMDILSIFYDTPSFLRFTLFIFIGITVGYYSEKKDAKISEAETRHTTTMDKLLFLREIHNESILAKDRLHYQILNAQDSMGTIFNLTKRLDSLDTKDIFYSAVNVIKQIMKSEKVAIYAVGSNKKFSRLVAKTVAEDFFIPSSINHEENAEFMKILKTNQIFINIEFQTDAPIIAAPILSDQEVVAIITVYEMEFEQMTLYYKNLLQIVVNLISSAITKAHKFELATEDQKYHPDTIILKEDYFKSLLNDKDDEVSELDISNVIIKITNKINDLKIASKILSRCLRETDYAAFINGGIFILLLNSDENSANSVIKRLSSLGINGMIVKEVDFND